MASQLCEVDEAKVSFIDSGCTSHMVKNKSLFRSFNWSAKTKVRIGNGALVQVEGRGFCCNSL